MPDQPSLDLASSAGASDIRQLPHHALDALGTFASGVAHDMNNLVAAIRGSAELLLLDLPDAGTARDDANDILVTCDRAMALTRQLLALSRPMSSTVATPVDEVVGAMEHVLRLVLGRPRTLQLALGAPHAYATIDRGQLERALAGLVVSAGETIPATAVLTIATAVVANQVIVTATVGDRVSRLPLPLAGPDADDVRAA